MIAKGHKVVFITLASIVSLKRVMIAVLAPLEESEGNKNCGALLGVAVRKRGQQTIVVIVT